MRRSQVYRHPLNSPNRQDRQEDVLRSLWQTAFESRVTGELLPQVRMEDYQMTHVKGRRVYLSGPMTGMEDWNRTTFDAAEKRLVCEPFDVMWIYNPADHIAEMRKWSHDRCLMASIRALCSRRPGPQHSIAAYDVLVSLPRWERSEGATLERYVAQRVGIEVCNLDEVVE